MHSEIGQKSENGLWCDGAVVCFPANFPSEFIIQIVNFKGDISFLGCWVFFTSDSLFWSQSKFNIILPMTILHVTQCNSYGRKSWMMIWTDRCMTFIHFFLETCFIAIFKKFNSNNTKSIVKGFPQTSRQGSKKSCLKRYHGLSQMFIF